MESLVWKECLARLEGELSSREFNTWIRPLHAVEDGASILLLAPNAFVRDWVNQHLLDRIRYVVARLSDGRLPAVIVQVGSRELPATHTHAGGSPPGETPAPGKSAAVRFWGSGTGLRREFTFDSLVEGKSNQLGLAASLQVAKNPGDAYNPLFIYGGVGLGKTHMMQAIGNDAIGREPNARVVYLHSERFVADMVKALQHNAIDEFKRFYRSVQTLLIDDIQFFAGKERSQEEFFHTFNALLEGQQQIVLTCDRYPKEVDGLEERLKSRFGWGLTVAIEPPELEMCVAILKKKASLTEVELSII